VDERLERLEQRVDRLSQTIDDLLYRLDALEAGRPVRSIRTREAEVESRDEEPPRSADRAPAGWLPLLGRTFLILGGAYLLRALTEFAVLPQHVGIVLGMAYGLLWLGMADRQSRPQQARSALYYGISSALIGFPILWEATTRFGFLSPEPAAAALAAYVILVVGVSGRRRLRALAWIGAVGGVATAGTLAMWTQGIPAFAACILLLGFLTLGTGYARDWVGLTWFQAFVVDLTLFLTGVLFLLGGGQGGMGLRPVPVLALFLVALLAYPGTFTLRSLVRRKEVAPLEILQTAMTLLLGLGGVVAISQRTGDRIVPGLACLFMAGLAYGASFTVIDRARGGRRNFIYQSSLAIVFALATGFLLVPSAWRAPLFVLLGFGSGLLGVRYQRATLAAHGVFYVLAAGIASDLFPWLLRNLFAPASGRWWPDLHGWMALAAAVGLSLFPPVRTKRTWGRLAGLPRALLFAVVAGGGAAILVGAGAALLGRGGRSIEPGLLAALRTLVLAVTAVLLARAGNTGRLAECGVLVYPILILGGGKLLLEDFRLGNPATLVGSLVSFGGALILVPWIRRHGGRTPPSPE